MKSINFRRDKKIKTKNKETDEVQMIPILKTVEKSNNPFCTARGADQRGVLEDVALCADMPLLAFT